MNPRVAFPFLLLPDDAVSFAGWLVGDPGQPLFEAEDMLEDWDYERDIEVSAGIEVDFCVAAAGLEVPLEELRLRAVLIVGTGTGNLPRRQYRMAEARLNVRNSSAELRCTVSGALISGRIQLGVQILFEGPVSGGSLLSPAENGARLWSDQHDILVEDGGDSRFPMEVVSFTQWFKGLPQERAPWYLHWRPGSLQSDFSGGVRLYVNADSSELASRFSECDSPTLQAILGDVMSQMISSALERADFEEVLEDCESGSIGHQIKGWIELAFPDQDIASIRAMRSQFPGRFQAAIHASAELGEENE